MKDKETLSTVFMAFIVAFSVLVVIISGCILVYADGVEDETQIKITESLESEPSSEPEPEIVEDEQNEVGMPVSQESKSSEISITPFASGLLVGELADLLQNNIIENDGYTFESWQRYESAVAAGWDVIANFITRNDEEVRTVINELTAAIAGLEYPPSHHVDTSDMPPSLYDMLAVGFLVVGALAGLAFVSKISWGF